jgi:hypothetical protein
MRRMHGRRLGLTFEGLLRAFWDVAQVLTVDGLEICRERPFSPRRGRKTVAHGAAVGSAKQSNFQPAERAKESGALPMDSRDLFKVFARN